ncbi:MAG: hypothetical protein HC895_16920 [Leptolyngbyaceae cyanobacterium SM1_3_5]|nr:hypothetical protein [Leptolyngbyaceae cyanobacterium SM1_3_5]
MPKILLESFPLTLKKGTGIYTYSLNLLRSLSELVSDPIGLLLLFETRFKKLSIRQNKKALIVLQNYADLMDDLSRNEGIGVDRRQRLIWIAKSLLAEPGLIEVPLYMKPSLREILTENTPTPYNFLEHNHPYVVDMSRPQLIARSRINSVGKIRVKHLTEQYDVFHCTHLSRFRLQDCQE